MLGGLGAVGEADDRGWDGWMASLTWWTWVWVNSRSWWWTGRPGMLRFMGCKESDTTERLNWTELRENFKVGIFISLLFCGFCFVSHQKKVFCTLTLKQCFSSYILPIAFLCLSLWTIELCCQVWGWEVRSEVAQSCPTICNSTDCNLSGSSIHGIFQARILEWVAISFSRGSSQPRDRIWVSCTAGRLYRLNHQGSLVWGWDLRYLGIGLGCWPITS